MENPETWATFGTPGTGRRQTLCLPQDAKTD